MRRLPPSTSVAVALLVALAVPARAGEREEGATADLSTEHRQWLASVEPLLTEEERDFFLALEEPFRRDAFIEEFWKVRDPDPRTPYNELRRSWERRVDQVLAEYGGLEDARGRMLLLNGEPGRYVLPGGRELTRCYLKTQEVEVWFYGGSRRTTRWFVVVFYRPRFGPEVYRVWTGEEPLRPRLRRRLPGTDPSRFCDGDILARAMAEITGDLTYPAFIDELLAPPAPRSREWLATFAATSAELPAGAETFAVGIDFAFPSRHQNRTAVQGILTVPAATGAGGAYLLTGEVVRDGRLFERFRYRFERGGGPAGAPLVFRRHLRPGTVRILLKLEELASGRFAHVDRALDVPSVPRRSPAAGVLDSELLRLLAEADAAAERGQSSIRIVPPDDSRIQLGGVRFHTLTAGDFDRVTFFLNDRPILTKTEPPFTVELNLGATAAAHRLRVAAFDVDGEELASDEILVNQGGQRFRVRLSEPRPDRRYASSLAAVVEVAVPDGAELDRVELYLAEERVATLYQPPFVQALLLDGEELTYVRAVGYLTDGNTSEDVVFVNVPEYFERVEVQLVELHASVLGPGGRPLTNLDRDDFTVFEDGAEQEILRFEYVENLAIHAGLLLDVSASMTEALPRVAAAAETFLAETVRPRDRVTLISFADRPQVEVPFTGEVAEIERALAGLRAVGSTALYDALAFALHYFDGIRGPKALLLISDGEDEASHFDLEGTLQVAHREGVTVFAIGLAEAARSSRSKKILTRIAGETGGRAFFVEDLAELPGVYRTIQEELRSQYLVAYQSTSTKDENEFRQVRLEVAGDPEVRTLAGYYP